MPASWVLFDLLGMDQIRCKADRESNCCAMILGRQQRSVYKVLQATQPPSAIVLLQHNTNLRIKCIHRNRHAGSYANCSLQRLPRKDVPSTLAEACCAASLLVKPPSCHRLSLPRTNSCGITITPLHHSTVAFTAQHAKTLFCLCAHDYPGVLSVIVSPNADLSPMDLNAFDRL